MAMLDLLYEHLLTTTNAIAEHLKCFFTAANRLISEFMELELLREMTGRQRNRRFRYDPYLAIFDQLNRQSG